MTYWLARTPPTLITRTQYPKTTFFTERILLYTTG